MAVDSMDTSKPYFAQEEPCTKCMIFPVSKKHWTMYAICWRPKTAKRQRTMRMMQSWSRLRLAHQTNRSHSGWSHSPEAKTTQTKTTKTEETTVTWKVLSQKQKEQYQRTRRYLTEQVDNFIHLIAVTEETDIAAELLTTPAAKYATGATLNGRTSLVGIICDTGPAFAGF